MKYTTKNTTAEFRTIMARRSNPTGFMLCRILKSGKPGKPKFYQAYGSEKTARDIIDRLMSNNPGDTWIEA